MVSATYLADFTDLADVDRRRDLTDELALARFLEEPSVAELGWPADVVEQWLFDHAGHGAFLRDYADVDLARVVWEEKSVSVAEFLTMPTGASEAEAIEDYASEHQWFLSRRPPDQQQAWADRGTWIRSPLVIDASTVGRSGWQLIEGRTRVGILRGRSRDGLHVAPTHRTWLGRYRR